MRTGRVAVPFLPQAGPPRAALPHPDRRAFLTSSPQIAKLDANENLHPVPDELMAVVWSFSNAHPTGAAPFHYGRASPSTVPGFVQLEEGWMQRLKEEEVPNVDLSGLGDPDTLLGRGAFGAVFLVFKKVRLPSRVGVSRTAALAPPL